MGNKQTINTMSTTLKTGEKNVMVGADKEAAGAICHDTPLELEGKLQKEVGRAQIQKGELHHKDHHHHKHHDSSTGHVVDHKVAVAKETGATTKPAIIVDKHGHAKDGVVVDTHTHGVHHTPAAATTTTTVTKGKPAVVVDKHGHSKPGVVVDSHHGGSKTVVSTPTAHDRINPVVVDEHLYTKHGDPVHVHHKPATVLPGDKTVIPVSSATTTAHGGHIPVAQTPGKPVTGTEDIHEGKHKQEIGKATKNKDLVKEGKLQEKRGKKIAKAVEKAEKKGL